MPRHEMLTRMSAMELTEWMAYYRIEPFGQERDELRAGQICSVIANVHRPKGKKAYSPKDFMLHQPKKRDQSPEQFDKAARSIFGPMVKRRGE